MTSAEFDAAILPLIEEINIDYDTMVDPHWAMLHDSGVARELIMKGVLVNIGDPFSLAWTMLGIGFVLGRAITQRKVDLEGLRDLFDAH